MPRQMFLPGFPDGSYKISASVSILEKDGLITYFVGSDSYFSHMNWQEDSRRFILATLMANRHVRPRDLMASPMLIPHRTLMNWNTQLRVALSGWRYLDTHLWLTMGVQASLTNKLTPTSDYKAMDESTPNRKISSLVYDFLKLPNPYCNDPEDLTEETQIDFSVLGTFQPCAIEGVMEHVVCCLRRQAQSDKPYTVSEFKRLLKNGTLIEQTPNQDDPELYCRDPQLAAMNPKTPIYRLRKAFIYRQAYRNYQNQQQDEENILNRFGKNFGTDQEVYKAYLAYLEADYSQALAPFFREWRLPVSEFDRERHTIITAKTGYGKSELIKLAIHRDI